MSRDTDRMTFSTTWREDSLSKSMNFCEALIACRSTLRALAWSGQPRCQTSETHDITQQQPGTIDSFSRALVLG